MQKINNFTLQAVEKQLQLKTWWAVWGVLPLANRLVVFVVNYTRFLPNSITGTALAFRFLSGICFLSQNYFIIVLAGLFYYMAYIMDCVDGPVARLTKKTSVKGRYFDHLSDLFGDLFILFCLAAGRHILFSPTVISMGVMHLLESYISYMAGLILSKEKGESGISGSSNGFIRGYQQYRNYFFSRKLKSFFSFPDYECMIFIIFPVLGLPLTGIRTGFYMLVVVVLYTVFSTFWSIHLKDARFP